MTAAAFTKDDHNLYTSSTDGTLIGWDIANLNNLGSQLSPPGSGVVKWMAASPTGEIAMEYPNGTVRFWRDTGAAPTQPIHVSTRQLIGGAFSPDGRLFATGDSDGTAQLVAVRSQRVISVARLPGPAHGVAFSPDGRRIAWTDDDGLLYYFNAASLRPTGRAQFTASRPRQLVWSPDSRHVAVVGAAHDPDGPVVIIVFNASTGVEDWRAPTSDGLAWSPDGTTIATGGDAATGIQLLRASDGTVVGGGWKDHAKTYTVAYSPDGSIIASTGLDGSVVLRDAATGEQIGPALTSSYNQQASIVRFDSTGRLIVSTEDGGLWRWTINLPYLLHQACAIAGRNLTTQEWADLHTGRPYLAACD